MDSQRSREAIGRSLFTRARRTHRPAGRRRDTLGLKLGRELGLERMEPRQVMSACSVIAAVPNFVRTHASDGAAALATLLLLVDLAVRRRRDG